MVKQQVSITILQINLLFFKSIFRSTFTYCNIKTTTKTGSTCSSVPSIRPTQRCYKNAIFSREKWVLKIAPLFLNHDELELLSRQEYIVATTLKEGEKPRTSNLFTKTFIWMIQRYSKKITILAQELDIRLATWLVSRAASNQWSTEMTQVTDLFNFLLFFIEKKANLTIGSRRCQ